MEDGDVKMNESVAIMTYLLERHGACLSRPAWLTDVLGKQQYARVDVDTDGRERLEWLERS